MIILCPDLSKFFREKSNNIVFDAFMKSFVLIHQAAIASHIDCRFLVAINASLCDVITVKSSA